MKPSDESDHELLFEEAFWKQFEIDLELVHARLIIQSGFIAYKRVHLVEALLKPLIKRNVQVCVFLQTPAFWDIPLERLPQEIAIKLKAFAEDIQVLQQIGVHLNLIPKVHMKFAILDEAVFYEGSLNILSHSDALEGMRRFTSPAQTRKKVRQERFLNCKGCQNMLHRFSFLNIQEQLIKARQRMNETQRTLAQKNDMNQSHIAKIESGADVRLGTLSQLARSLDHHPILVPSWLLPILANLFAKQEDNELLGALIESNRTPERSSVETQYTNFASPEQSNRVKEQEFAPPEFMQFEGARFEET